MKRLAWLLVLPLTPLFVVFAVANRHIVTISFDPTPIVFEAPLYSIVLASAFVGIVVGGFISWLRGFRYRSRLRNKQQAADRREIQLHPTIKTAGTNKTEIIKAI